MPEFFKKTSTIISAVVVVVLLIVGAVTISSINSIRNEGIRQENALVGQFNDAQLELSTYILSFNEVLGVADRGADKINEILLDAVKGRYDSSLTAEPGSGQLFNAISEAYPDLTATAESYEKVQDLIISGRNSYKNEQRMLVDQVRVYNTWRQTGLFKSSVINMLGFPSDSLSVRVGNRTFTGQAALDEISTLVLTSDAIEAYETGEIDPLLMPESD